MIPETIEVKEELTEQPGLTFKIDFENNKIKGKIDGLEAVKQAVFLMLTTEKDYSPIYSDYGIRILDLIGQDFYLVVSEIKRRVIETLMTDNRIVSLGDFTFEESVDGLITEFKVISNQGVFTTKGVFKV